MRPSTLRRRMLDPHPPVTQVAVSVEAGHAGKSTVGPPSKGGSSADPAHLFTQCRAAAKINWSTHRTAFAPNPFRNNSIGLQRRNDCAMSEFGMTIEGDHVIGHRMFEVVDPATGEVFAQAPECSPAQLDAAMHSALSAFTDWAADDDRRREVLDSAAAAVLAAADPLAELLTAEQGKPLADSRREIASAALWLRYFAQLELAPEIVRNGKHSHARIYRRALGVVAAITPWNFPIALAMWKIAPALRAGNTMLLKPSPCTPLSSLELGRILAGVLPAGVLNVVSGTDPLGAAITAHPTPRKISFTGSISTGRLVGVAAAQALKPATLELGGNDPAILLDDVVPAEVAEALFWAAFGNNGQTCFAVKRVYVPDALHDEVADALIEIAGRVRVGDGRQPGVQLGPLINGHQLDRVRGLVADAVRHGATATAGKQAVGPPGFFCAPTIVTDVTDGIRLVDDEQFGPALPIIRYHDLDDAVARADNGRYGLTASVWSGDPEWAHSIATRLDCGQVSINAHGGAVRPHLPFGGHKYSGIGVENGIWGLHEFTSMQVISGPSGT